MALRSGDKCPSFTLPNQHGENINIDEFIGKRILIIYFYPKDDTPGCTKEACMFRDSYEEFVDMGCEVIGISSDSIESHRKFAETHRLSFPLLADEKGQVRKQFGVPGNLFGLIPGRVTYIVDKKGLVREVHNSLLDPAGHLNKAIETVKKISSEV
jgi:thioredoxin-dependent peroxiredoxin